MARSWELTENQKKEIQEQQCEIGTQYDPETGRKKGKTENTGDNEEVKGVEGMEGRSRHEIKDDENIR